MYVNYPQFNYKRAFLFLYTVLNIYRIDEQIDWMFFEPITTNEHDALQFWFNRTCIIFCYYNKRTNAYRYEIDLCKKLTKDYKRKFYSSVFCHFFGDKVKKIDYEDIDRDVPIKILRSR